MRLIRACYCLLLCSAAALATSSPEDPPSSTETSGVVDIVPTSSSSAAEVLPESTIAISTPIESSLPLAEPLKEEETASEGISSSLATSTSSSSSHGPIASSAVEQTIPATPSEPPAAPSTSSSPLPSSPPVSDPSPTLTPSPSLSIPPLPSISIVSEVPLTSIPPVPEFLSFNEWKEKYVVVPDPSIALARRAKKAAQRQRQDVVGSDTVGDKGASYDGDGADLGSLFASGEEIGGDSSTLSSQAEGTRKDEKRPKGGKGDIIRRSEAGEPASNSLSPIQPLPNVGTGDDNDPLIPLKDRSNYAAFECAAMVHRSSRKTKGASAILVEKKDRYMLTPCSADPKFVEVELCDEIQIDTIVLANFEFFSSMFKHFKASCSVNYPGNAEDWHDLGTFRARNVRGVQVFRPNLIPNFCRYIRINFLSHFGSEYYCPVSLLRVYGYTQLDAYRESERKARQLQEALAAAEEYVEDEIEEEEEEVPLPTEELVRPVETSQEGVKKAEPLPTGEKIYTEEDLVRPSPKLENGTEVVSNDDHQTQTSTTPAAPSTQITSAPMPSTESNNDATSTISSTSILSSSVPTPTVSLSMQIPPETLDNRTSPHSSQATALSSSSRLSSSPSSDPATSSPPTSSPSDVVSSAPSTISSPTSSPIASPSASATSSVVSRPAAPSDLPIVNPRPVPSRNDTPPVQPYHPLPHRAPVISPPIQQPQPGESIYATIMKRLTSLEHNQTLSMHFIEAQSSMLREAFTRIERRLSEVEASRSRQEQGIRQALLDLEKERNDLERERLGLSTQVGMLAQEIRLEKRLSAAQLVGTLLLIIFVGFTRSIPTSPFLHLASSAQTQRRTPVKRDTGETEELQPSTEEKSSPDLTRKPLGRRTSGTGGTKHSSGHSKRQASMSKPGPRRHYGTGTSSSSRTPAFAKSPRAWTPPLRHSSAPPEEPPTASTSTALEGKALRRRHGSNRRPGSPFEFPRRSKLDTELGLAIESVPSRQFNAASPSTLNHPLPNFLDSTSRQLSRNSAAEDADAERSAAGESLTNGDYDHYTTTDDEDEPPLSPVTPAHLPPPVVAPLPTTSFASSGIRPPKPTLPSRPSTSMGIPFPSNSLSSSKSDSDFSRRSPQHRNAPTPPSTLPSPPPEPALVPDPPLVK